MDYLKDLNSEQLASVVTADGYVRVIAGAGSGKTRALTARYAFLMDVVGVRADNILCVTFTNKAAKVMVDRIRNYIGEEIDLPYIRTIHSFCNLFLRIEGGVIGLNRSFKIIDDSDQKQLGKQVLRDIELLLDASGDNTDIILKSKDTCNIISEYKSRAGIDSYVGLMLNNTPEEIWREVVLTESVKEKFIKGYLAEQRSNQYLDYDDLINMTLYILRHYKKVAEKWQNKFRYIQVDEFQDVNEEELEILAILSAKYGNLFVVGDPDQCLYSFRGAEIGCLLNFQDKVSNYTGKEVSVVTLYLNTNYRSTPEITSMANTLIKNNKMRLDKQLKPIKGSGMKAEHVTAQNTDEETDWVVTKIKEMHDKGYKYSDMAILYRMNSCSRAFEKRLFNRGIPYKIIKGVMFYNRKEVKNVLAILGVLAYRDNISLQRCFQELKLKIGNKRVEVLIGYSNENNCSLYDSLKSLCSTSSFVKTLGKAFVDAISELEKILVDGNSLVVMYDKLLEIFDFKSDYIKEPDRYENILELGAALREYENNFIADEVYDKPSVAGFLDSVSLLQGVEEDEDNGSVSRDTVQLMTVHSSKGLEFPVVFLVNCIQGVLPHYKSLNDEIGIEEERRIFYVAVTRAEDFLFITDNKGYGFYTSFASSDVSQFLFEIPQEIFNTKVLGEQEESNKENIRLLRNSSPDVLVAYSYLNDEQKGNFWTIRRLLKSKDYCEMWGNWIDLNILSYCRVLEAEDINKWISHIKEDSCNYYFTNNNWVLSFLPDKEVTDILTLENLLKS